jgi:hypothetical protein
METTMGTHHLAVVKMTSCRCFVKLEYDITVFMQLGLS